MCGIAGFVNHEGLTRPDDPRLPDMISTLQHRGPDGFGYFGAPGVGLAHARLSIIDLAGGAQPIHNEDRSVWITFNGEIFNYLELRADLEKQGHRFETRSDTEVLVHAYEEYGDEFVHQLNGQFAFAIWDGRRRRLVLARDRAGILPLFYTERGGRLLFASEIKAHPGGHRCTGAALERRSRSGADLLVASDPSHDVPGSLRGVAWPDAHRGGRRDSSAPVPGTGVIRSTANTVKAMPARSPRSCAPC